MTTRDAGRTAMTSWLSHAGGISMNARRGPTSRSSPKDKMPSATTWAAAVPGDTSVVATGPSRLKTSS